jgi:hypothetical protein
MNSDENPREFYNRFHGQLETSQDWPGLYMFKFIVKSKNFQIDKLKNLFDNSHKEVSLVNSSKNTFQSLTIKIQMASPDEVIDIYKKVGQFDDVIIL